MFREVEATPVVVHNANENVLHKSGRGERLPPSRADAAPRSVTFWIPRRGIVDVLSGSPPDEFASIRVTT
jgi:hypothetical protein